MALIEGIELQCWHKNLKVPGLGHSTFLLLWPQNGWGTGDSLSKAVTWEEQSDLSPLAGQSIRIRFILMDAELFSFRFE